MPNTVGRGVQEQTKFLSLRYSELVRLTETMSKMSVGDYGVVAILNGATGGAYGTWGTHTTLSSS